MMFAFFVFLPLWMSAAVEYVEDDLKVAGEQSPKVVSKRVSFVLDDQVAQGKAPKPSRYVASKKSCLLKKQKEKSIAPRNLLNVETLHESFMASFVQQSSTQKMCLRFVHTVQGQPYSCVYELPSALMTTLETTIKIDQASAHTARLLITSCQRSGCHGDFEVFVGAYPRVDHSLAFKAFSEFYVGGKDKTEKKIGKTGFTAELKDVLGFRDVIADDLHELDILQPIEATKCAIGPKKDIQVLIYGTTETFNFKDYFLASLMYRDRTGSSNSISIVHSMISDIEAQITVVDRCGKVMFALLYPYEKKPEDMPFGEWCKYVHGAQGGYVSIELETKAMAKAEKGCVRHFQGFHTLNFLCEKEGQLEIQSRRYLLPRDCGHLSCTPPLEGAWDFEVSSSQRSLFQGRPTLTTCMFSEKLMASLEKKGYERASSCESLESFTPREYAFLTQSSKQKAWSCQHK